MRLLNKILLITAIVFNDGKNDLNFSEFGSYSLRRQINKFRSIINSINDDTMPLLSYTWMHKEARLTRDEKAIIINWANKTKDIFQH